MAKWTLEEHKRRTVEDWETFKQLTRDEDDQIGFFLDPASMAMLLMLARRCGMVSHLPWEAMATTQAFLDRLLAYLPEEHHDWVQASEHAWREEVRAHTEDRE